MHMVAGYDIDRDYKGEEIIRMYQTGALRGISLEGYVTQVENGTVRFIPWQQSYHFRDQTKTLKTATFDGTKMLEEVEHDHPITRRTPQERTTAMVMRMMPTIQATGTLPGYTTEQIRAIVGDYWKEGEPVTEDMVRKLCAYLLQQAQHTNREADSHRSARAHMTA